MTARYSLSDVASLIGEPTRAAMLLAVLDGRALPANELARAANLSAGATSIHLAKLTQGGLLLVRQEGRHRHYRLAGLARRAFVSVRREVRGEVDASCLVGGRRFGNTSVETDTNAIVTGGAIGTVDAHSSSYAVKHHMYTARVYRCSNAQKMAY